MRKLAILICAVISLGANCGNNPVVPHPPPPSDPTWCGPAEDKLVALGGCGQAVSPKGRHFKDICMEKHANGVDLHAECIATNPKVKTCDDIDPICTWGTR